MRVKAVRGMMKDGRIDLIILAYQFEDASSDRAGPGL